MKLPPTPLKTVPLLFSITQYEHASISHLDPDWNRDLYNLLLFHPFNINLCCVRPVFLHFFLTERSSTKLLLISMWCDFCNSGGICNPLFNSNSKLQVISILIMEKKSRLIVRDRIRQCHYHLCVLSEPLGSRGFPMMKKLLDLPGVGWPNNF